MDIRNLCNVDVPTPQGFVKPCGVPAVGIFYDSDADNYKICCQQHLDALIGDSEVELMYDPDAED